MQHDLSPAVRRVPNKTPSNELLSSFVNLLCISHYTQQSVVKSFTFEPCCRGGLVLIGAMFTVLYCVSCATCL